MKQKNFDLRGAVKRAFSVVAIFAVLLATMIVPSGCAEEQLLPNGKDTVTTIIDRYYYMERVLSVVATPKDSLAKSVVGFEQESYVHDEQDEITLNFQPVTYLNISLSKDRIAVKDASELPTEVVDEYVVSNTPYKGDNMYGKDVVKVFEFADGQVATVSYGERYYAIINNGDTLSVPHVEVQDVAFNKQIVEEFGKSSEWEQPYKSTLVFDAYYEQKGTSSYGSAQLVELKPWYNKPIAEDPLEIYDVSYTGKFVGCPYNAYELTEYVSTNKGEKTNVYKVDLSLEFDAPKTREQPSLDSLFNSASTGDLTEKVFSEIKNENGFTVKTITGNYVSSNVGKENNTKVENTMNFTYQYPTLFESAYGSYKIPAPILEFEEIGFVVKKMSETSDYITYKTINTIQGSLGECLFDEVDEVVNLKLQREKAPNVVKVDSTYTIGGSGDDYIVDKIIIWSDGSKTSSKYEYKGRHSIKANHFGEKVTSSLSWSEASLGLLSQSKGETYVQNYSKTTRFETQYMNYNWVSKATNGNESGNFGYVAESPVVKFIDGSVVKEFPERKYNLTGVGADVASNYTTVTRNGVSYNAYKYDYTAKASFNGGTASSVVSNGTLLMTADVVGDAKYDVSQTWNGRTTTVTVKKTIPHSHANDEVFNYSKSFTIGLSDLTDDKLYANNTSFSVTSTNDEDVTDVPDGYWSIKTRTRNYTYVLSNGEVSRNMPTTVKDGVITFDDGTFKHTFDISMDVSHREALGNTTQSGEYSVTPHTLTVNGVVSGKNFSVDGKTDIYVKNQEPEYPHYGKPRSFVVTATFDPTAKVTRRAFIFNWDEGVTYAVCDYETMLPTTADFMYKTDTYREYNSVGYDKSSSGEKWQPAKGVDGSSTIEWKRSDGSVMSAITNAECMTYGWKNVKDGDYALVIDGYTYTINGYYITVTAPNGEKVTFNSHHE